MNRLSTILARIESAFPKDSVRRLLLQFVFIAVLGQWIAASFTQRTEDFSRRAELRQLRAQERYAFTEKFATNAQRRAYLMGVVIWEVTLHNKPTVQRKEALKTRYEEYRKELVEWNALLKYHQIAISRNFPVDAQRVHEAISQHALFESRPEVKPAPSLLHPLSEYRAYGRSLRSLAVLLQEDLQRTHAIIKRIADSRLIDETPVKAEDLKLLTDVHPHLNDRVFAYAELLVQLSGDLEVEGH